MSNPIESSRMRSVPSGVHAAMRGQMFAMAFPRSRAVTGRRWESSFTTRSERGTMNHRVAFVRPALVSPSTQGASRGHCSSG